MLFGDKHVVLFIDLGLRLLDAWVLLGADTNDDFCGGRGNNSSDNFGGNRAGNSSNDFGRDRADNSSDRADNSSDEFDGDGGISSRDASASGVHSGGGVART